MFITLIAALGAVALLIIGLSIKMLIKRRGQFKRPCTHIDPYTGEGTGCICGKSSAAHCHENAHSPLEVNEELMKEL